MPASQNGWSASPDLPVVPLVVDGVAFAPGIRGGDVHTVLGYVAQQVADRVEKPVDPGCWGFFFRANRNDPNSLSNHSSGTAIDFNAPQHPNGVPTTHTWSTAQIREIHKILGEVDGVVRWGGDFQITPDAMHFEINADAAAVAAVASTLEDPMASPEVQDQLNRIERIVTNLRDAGKRRNQRIMARLSEIATEAKDDATAKQLRALRDEIAAAEEEEN